MQLLSLQHPLRFSVSWHIPLKSPSVEGVWLDSDGFTALRKSTFFCKSPETALPMAPERDPGIQSLRASCCVPDKARTQLVTCPHALQGLKNQTQVKLNIVSCPPVTTVLIKRPDLKYQLGFSVQNGIVSLSPHSLPGLRIPRVGTGHRKPGCRSV